MIRNKNPNRIIGIVDYYFSLNSTKNLSFSSFNSNFLISVSKSIILSLLLLNLYLHFGFLFRSLAVFFSSLAVDSGLSEEENYLFFYQTYY